MKEDPEISNKNFVWNFVNLIKHAREIGVIAYNLNGEYTINDTKIAIK